MQYTKLIYKNKELIGEIEAVEEVKVWWLYYQMLGDNKGKGYMSKHLPKFLNYIKRKGVKIIFAKVLNENLISEHLLKKNEFVMLKQFKRCKVYVRIL